ncbi:chaplin [Streptomyces kronopolitis]
MAHSIKSVLVTAAACSLVLGGAGLATADSGAAGTASDSPGIVAGNTILIPIHLPVSLCNNTISVIGALNPAFGTPCFGG